MTNIKISDKQFDNFLNICALNGEYLDMFSDEELKERLELLINHNGYWCGEAYRYYLEGDDWREEIRQEFI